jgi:transcriptional regulator with XRE-family HTH domain
MADSFGELLRRFRVAASLTQEALAERCRISPATIAAIEQGQRTAPRLSTVRPIAEALEGLGCLAAGQASAARAGQLLSAARHCRQDIGYHYRFSFEQRLLDQAGLTAAPAPQGEPPLRWQAAVAVALKPPTSERRGMLCPALEVSCRPGMLSHLTMRGRLSRT